MTQENIEQDLQYIKKVLENNRKMLVDNGIFYILWGVLAVLGATSSYLFLYLDIMFIGPYFIVGLIIIFTFIQNFLNKKIDADKHISSLGWKIFNAVWHAAGITIGMFTIIFFSTNIVPVTVFVGVVAAIFGIAYYLTGIINDLPFLTKLSFAWWISTIVLILWEQFFNLYYIALFFAGLILFLQIIPGIVIYKKWKSHYAG